jgi:hypothetical protein
MSKPLGRIQYEVLRCLVAHEREANRYPGSVAGQWTRGCGWHWDTPSNTERMFESLARRGLVDRHEEKFKSGISRVTFTLNETGREIYRWEKLLRDTARQIAMDSK